MEQALATCSGLKKSFYYGTDEVLSSPTLTTTMKVVYDGLSYYASRAQNLVHPSVRTLAEHIKISMRHVRRMLRALESQHVIETTPYFKTGDEGRGQSSNTYRLLASMRNPEPPPKVKPKLTWKQRRQVAALERAAQERATPAAAACPPATQMEQQALDRAVEQAISQAIDRKVWAEPDSEDQREWLQGIRAMPVSVAVCETWLEPLKLVGISKDDGTWLLLATDRFSADHVVKHHQVSLARHLGHPCSIIC